MRVAVVVAAVMALSGLWFDRGAGPAPPDCQTRHSFTVTGNTLNSGLQKAAP